MAVLSYIEHYIEYGPYDGITITKETANETLFIILVASAMICAVYCIKNWKNKC